MFRVQKLQQLAEALRARKSVVMSARGAWKVRSKTVAALHSFVGLHTSNFLRFANRFIASLDYLESFAVRFGKKGEAVQQMADFDGYLRVAVELYAQLSEVSGEGAKELRHQLQERIVALSYRVESVHGGMDRLMLKDQPQFLELRDYAVAWKAEQAAFSDSNLSQLEERRLRQTARYPAFVALLTENSALRERFFKWVIRDGVDADVFVEYPALREKLEHAHLPSRIGRYGGRQLRIQKQVQNGIVRKIVTLPFEGKDINILDEQRSVTLRGDYRVSLRDVFATFRSKLEKVGDFEYLADGITNWNGHLLAHWDATQKEYQAVNMNRAGWWKQLPVMEKLTLRQAQRRYGKHLDGQNWNVAVNATRTTRTLDPDASHAFLEIAIPTAAGNYEVYAMGKFATTYAGSLFQSMSLFTATLHATIAYPDENIFYTHREHVRQSFAITAEEGFQFMNTIRRDIVKARAGTLTYQIESENCAKWIQDKLHQLLGMERVPDLFRIAMLDTEPFGPARAMFAVLRRLPSALHSPVLSFLHLLIGGWRGIWIEENGQREWRSLTTTQFWRDKVCYLPAVLHQKLAAGEFIHADLNVMATPLHYGVIATLMGSAIPFAEIFFILRTPLKLFEWMLDQSTKRSFRLIFTFCANQNLVRGDSKEVTMLRIQNAA